MKTSTIISIWLAGAAAVLMTSPVWADELFQPGHFDLEALIWMLAGAAAAGVGCWIHSYLSSVKRLPSPVPKIPVPANGTSPGNGNLRMDSPEQGGQPEARPMEYWVNLDEATTVSVKELSRIEEEAETFLITGRPDVAIRVLRDYLDFDPDSRITVWFKLLDIYHSQNMRPLFNALAQEIRARFNVELPTWDSSTARYGSRHGLEHFPALLERISQHWDEPDGLEYLDGLMRDNRQGGRSGFHEDAFRDVLLLRDVLEIKLMGGKSARD